MKKRWMALALCLMMIVALIPASALADEPTDAPHAAAPHVVPPKPEIPTPDCAPGTIMAEDPLSDRKSVV